MASMLQADPAGGTDPRPARDPAGAARLAAFRLQAAGEHNQSLCSLIEREIIPRLVVAHADGGPTIEPCAADAPITAADIEDMAALSMRVEAGALIDHVEAIVARGATIETLLVDLLAPVARLLGTYWEEDRCDFLDVTMALWRLQEAVHELAARIPARRPTGADGRRALFASMPGDQHSFGTVVIDELFRREGWLTERITEAETPDLLRHAADQWLDLVGLTISCDCHIGQLTSIIVGLRNVSRNPRLCVMVGGRIFSADPALAATVGADGTARDAKLALQIASGLVRAREREAEVSC